MSARVCLSVLLSTSYFALPAQLLPSNPGRFGVDGDIAANERAEGAFEPSGSHDWFAGGATAAYSVFDTLGAAALKPVLSAGANQAFTRKMQHAPFSVQDGVLLLGGTFARDHYGVDNTGGLGDPTMFVPSALTNKSTAAPGSWTTVPSGGTLPSKSDIIDAYIHMRRNGTSVAAGSPSPLLIYLAASTLSTGGDHYLDFELYKSEITYNSTTGLFSSAGPALTGGRNIWEFNADGTVKTYGEMALSFSFSSTEVSDIAIYIWVPYSTYSGTDPRGFDFVKKNGWEGALGSSGYGYARIQPNAGDVLQAWGTVNSSSTPAPAWGTQSREGASGAGGYFSAQYSAGQLAEAAINLSSLGIDPAFASGGGQCGSPYVKVLVKSRSSSAFASSLQDFVAPFELFEAPVMPAPVVEPALITCSQATQTLQPREVISGAIYKWTTTEGRIISGATTPQAVVAAGGRYFLSAALYEGCSETITEVVVAADTLRPVASAGYTGFLSADPGSYITLRGGDAEACNYDTAFGPSAGLAWIWTGPDGYTATEQNPRASAEGVYHLTVKELRNGCTATASVEVSMAGQMTLPLALLHFTGSEQGRAVELSWSVEENRRAGWFEVQEAAGASGFTAAAVVLATGTKDRETYSIKVRFNGEPATYRLKTVDREGKVQYSRAIRITGKPTPEEVRLNVLQNPVIGDLVVAYSAEESSPVTVRLFTAAGQLVYSGRQSCAPGVNQLLIAGGYLASKGPYIVEITDAKGTVSRARAVKL